MSILFGSHAAQQEREQRGYRWFWQGIQGPDVRPPVSDAILVRQELPWHPSSFFWSAPPPIPKVPSFQRPVIVTQELPWHPGSHLHAGTPPIVFEECQFFVIP